VSDKQERTVREGMYIIICELKFCPLPRERELSYLFRNQRS